MKIAWPLLKGMCFLATEIANSATGGYPRCWYRAAWHLMFRLPPTVAQVSHGTLDSSYSTFGQKEKMPKGKSFELWSKAGFWWKHIFRDDLLNRPSQGEIKVAELVVTDSLTVHSSHGRLREHMPFVKLCMLPDFTQLHSQLGLEKGGIIAKMTFRWGWWILWNISLSKPLIFSALRHLRRFWPNTSGFILVLLIKQWSNNGLPHSVQLGSHLKNLWKENHVESGWICGV